MEHSCVNCNDSIHTPVLRLLCNESICSSRHVLRNVLLLAYFAYMNKHRV